MEHPHTVLFYGMTGAGKGTQAKLLVEELNERDAGRGTLYIETGKRFRDFLHQPNHTAQLVTEAFEKGALLPEYLPIWIWGDALIKEFDGSQHLVLDGLARRIAEAPVLDGALRFYRREHPKVVVLSVNKEEVLDRLKKRGRNDDSLEPIRAKIEWYEQNVVPTIEYFREQTEYYTVCDVDGSGTIEEVRAAVRKAVFG